MSMDQQETFEWLTERSKRLEEAEKLLAAHAEQIEKLHVALTKINDIRNSIVGYQNVGASQHIYPLVAALEEAGYAGMGYEKAKEMIRSNESRDEQTKKLRRLLWLNHARYIPGVHMPYGDDGEMQCCGIDFKRWTVDQIDEFIAARAILPPVDAEKGA